MTKKRRVLNIITGMLMIAAAIALTGIGTLGLDAVLVIVGTGLLIRGLQSLTYYLRMARSMVGGKTVLYKAILLLDLGIFTNSVAGSGQWIAIVYVAFLNLFEGVVTLMHSIDEKKLGAKQWKLGVAYGAVNILIAVAVLVSGFGLHAPTLAVYAYALGLLYSGASKIVSAFRRTAIVYIQ